MRHELSVIQTMGFAGYFLIVADFIGYARKQGIPVGPGRGSSAGSVVAWSLGITGVDPIEYDIIFERFLNPERISMPDIDVDFCMRGRDEVIRYVAEKYDMPGDDGRQVSQIVTFGTLQARAAIRDVGRGDGAPVRRRRPRGEARARDARHHARPGPRAVAGAAARGSRPTARSAKLIETARRLEGLTRHASTHAAGVVIGNRPLIEMVPLYRDARSGAVMTQWDMRCVEKVGLIKFDFLGLRTLTAIADAERRIRAGRLPGLLRRPDPARRRAELRAHVPRRHRGRVPARVVRHDRPRR